MSDSVDLAKKGLISMPEYLLKLSHLKMLYLEGNQIEALPEDLFQRLPLLTWLDVRNNRLKTLPTGIKNHQELRTLLIQNNAIEALPLELGFVPKLRTLQLVGNPLSFPPQKIIKEGLAALVGFLQQEHKKQIDGENTDVITIKEPSSTATVKKPKKTRTTRMSKVGKSQSAHSGLENDKLKPYHNSCKYLEMLPQRDNELRVADAEFKEAWYKHMREIIETQSHKLRRLRQTDLLRDWRTDPKNLKRKKLDYEYSPPFGTYPEYDKVLCRAEVLRGIQKIRKQKAKNHPKNGPINMDDMIKELLKTLKTIDYNVNADRSPRSQLNTAGEEIKKIKSLQKKLSVLKLANDSEMP